MVEVGEQDLNTILARQLLIAWIGEDAGEPKRLGWWRTDLVDPDGGAFLLEELLPKTYAWAALDAAREAAILVDRRLRSQQAEGDRLRTLFHWGEDLDRALARRLYAWKTSGDAPEKALPLLEASHRPFDPDALEKTLRELRPDTSFEVVPDAREIVEPPTALGEQADALAACFVPWGDSYPMPCLPVDQP